MKLKPNNNILKSKMLKENYTKVFICALFTLMFGVTSVFASVPSLRILDTQSTDTNNIINYNLVESSSYEVSLTNDINGYNGYGFPLLNLGASHESNIMLVDLINNGEIELPDWEFHFNAPLTFDYDELEVLDPIIIYDNIEIDLSEIEVAYLVERTTGIVKVMGLDYLIYLTEDLPNFDYTDESILELLEETFEGYDVIVLNSTWTIPGNTTVRSGNFMILTSLNTVPFSITPTNNTTIQVGLVNSNFQFIPFAFPNSSFAVPGTNGAQLAIPGGQTTSGTLNPGFVGTFYFGIRNMNAQQNTYSVTYSVS